MLLLPDIKYRPVIKFRSQSRNAINPHPHPNILTVNDTQGDLGVENRQDGLMGCDDV
jgi:hypothetical protein